MSAKSKPSKDEEQGSYLEADRDPELEKKIDALLSVDQPDPIPESDEEKDSKEAENSDRQPSTSPPPDADSKKPSKSNIKVSFYDEQSETDTDNEEAALDKEESDDSSLPVSPSPIAPVSDAPPSSPPASVKSGAPLLPDSKAQSPKSKSLKINFHDQDAEETSVKEDASEEHPLLPLDPSLTVDDDEEAESESVDEDGVGEPEGEDAEQPIPEETTDKEVDSTETPESQSSKVDNSPIATRQQVDAIDLEDVRTSRAVDDIIASEADELLKSRDEERANDESVLKRVDKKNNAKSRSKTAPRFKKSTVIKIVLALLLIVSLGLMIAPTSRYFILNSSGVRVSSSVKILDSTNGQPLKNAEFIIDDQAGKTDGEGVAKLNKLKLGPHTLRIKKPAFVEVTQPVTLGWGSNPLGEYRLQASGTQYRLTITDFLSKQPIAKAEASGGSTDARSDDKGEIVITLPHSNLQAENITFDIKADNYRTEKLTLSTIKKEAPQSVQMVPKRKHTFISKRSGSLDVYKVDVDGKNEEKVLSGTGLEKAETMALSPHPTKDVVALVSVREENKLGAELNHLNLINLQDNTSIKVAHSERIQLVDWIGDKLIYVKIADGTNESSADRHRLISYDILSNSERELAKTNYFNDVISVNGNIYYSPAAYQNNGAIGLFKVNADGNYRKTIFDKEVWNLARAGFEKVNLSIGQEWYELDTGSDKMTKASGNLAGSKSRVYFNNPSNDASLWVDERDGKGVILSYDQHSKNDKVLHTQSGVKNPLYWLDADHIIYRVKNNQETADYILSTEGGSTRKIKDVTDTAGIDRWYYY